MLTASYYPNKGRKIVTINHVRDGVRRHITDISVSGKREAAKIVDEFGARPWNF